MGRKEFNLKARIIVKGVNGKKRRGSYKILKKRGETAFNSFTPEGHLILLSISTALRFISVT
ncbi:hypothetical protein [Fodinibius saliphilus]|uniref:hypothetical protein n=1 Tax=Fodinibius saliphilus TaxID=1920650 RepID=UPI001108DEF4|nr:hypothetical protein [Fodinibius saliphilus]